MRIAHLRSVILTALLSAAARKTDSIWCRLKEASLQVTASSKQRASGGEGCNLITESGSKTRSNLKTF